MRSAEIHERVVSSKRSAIVQQEGKELYYMTTVPVRSTEIHERVASDK